MAGRKFRSPSALRELLARPGFRRLYGTRLLSQAADGVFQASLASAIFFSPERQTDAAAVAAGFSILLLPYSLVGPFAGVLLDRWSRARILVRANLARAALVLAVAAVLAFLGPDGPAFYLLALAVISVNRFFLATLSAGLPRVVPAGDLVPANALSVTSGTFATIAGAGLGVALRGSGSDGATALVALLAGSIYVASSLVARGFLVESLGPPSPSGAEPGSERRPLRTEFRLVAVGFVAGARHVAARGPASRALAAITAHRFLFGVTSLITLLVYRNTFSDDGLLRAGLPGLTQVVVASGVGTLGGALLTPPVVRRITKPLWVASVLAIGAAVEVAVGVPYEKAGFLAAGLALGFVSQASKVSVDTIVQENIDDSFRGRVFSFYDTLFNLAFVAAAALAAVVLPDSGVSRPTIAALAAGYAIAAVAYGISARREMLNPPS
jgi:MFS family permease